MNRKDDVRMIHFLFCLSNFLAVFNNSFYYSSITDSASLNRYFSPFMWNFLLNELKMPSQ